LKEYDDNNKNDEPKSKRQKMDKLDDENEPVEPEKIQFSSWDFTMNLTTNRMQPVKQYYSRFD